MTEKDSILWQQAITRILEENEDWDAKNNSEKYNVAFNNVLMPAKVVLKRAFAYMEEHHPEVELKRIRGGVPTNQFIESLGFTIKEDLVYNSTEKSKLLSQLENKISNKKTFQDFIHFGYSLLNTTQIDEYKVRMAIESSGVLSVILGMRTIYSYVEKEGKSHIGFIVSKAFRNKNKEVYDYAFEHEYEGAPDQDFIKLAVEDWSEIDDKVLEESKEQVAILYGRVKDSKLTQWNVEAKTTNSALKYLMFKNSVVEDWIENNGKTISNRSYWALGFNSNYERLEKFKKENYWQGIDYDFNDNSGPAKLTRKHFNDIQIGDYVVIKGFGGRHDLVTHYKGEVVGIDNEKETLSLKKISGPLYQGKAPRGEGSGKWYDTIIPVKRKQDIDLIFFNKKSEGMENVKKEFIQWLIKNPKANYFENDAEVLDRYLTTYNSYFDVDIFQCSNGNYKNIIKIIDGAAYGNENQEFLDYSFKESRHRPRAILGKPNYFKFLQEKFGSSQEIEDFFVSSNVISIPLNLILYGPPGTGKTFKLQHEFFDKFTVSETSQTKQQYIENVASNLTWWQTFAIVLSELGISDTKAILDHELVKAKSNLSSNKNVRATVWGRLQAHTVLECPNVNVSDRSEPQIFYKEEDSRWRVIEDRLRDLYPEAFEISEQINNYSPSPDKYVKNYEFITFHQSFSYEDFIEGIKPKMEGEEGALSYEIQDGIFKKLSLKAKADPENNYAIFIDEINRGNVSAIFGELITLIEKDKRIGAENELNIKLPYSKTDFGVPSNLYIIGTMNTADRSVEALDTALRRRFSFEEIMPNPEVLENFEVSGIDLTELHKKINERVEALVDRDHTIGHSYFMKVMDAENPEEKLVNVFKDNIIPLLQEYFFGDYSKIGMVLGNKFVKSEELDPNKIFATFDEVESIDLGKKYTLVPLDDINIETIQSILD